MFKLVDMVNEKRKREERKRKAQGMFVGTALGAALGVLFAPRPGKESRDQLSEKAKEKSESVKKGLHDSVEKAKEASEKAKKTMEEKKSELSQKTSQLKETMEEKKEKAKHEAEEMKKDADNVKQEVKRDTQDMKQDIKEAKEDRDKKLEDDEILRGLKSEMDKVDIKNPKNQNKKGNKW